MTSDSPLDIDPAAGILPSGSVLGGRFELAGRSGDGVFGPTYRAIDATTSQAVTLQILRPDLLLGAGVREHLRHELELAARLEHRSLATPRVFGLDDEHAWVVTELADGLPLATLLARKLAAGQFFSLRGAYNVVVPVLDGLGHAHQQTIHGAVATANILVSPTGRVKLHELGLARALLPAVTAAATAPDFSHLPERVDRRVDIWGVAAVLQELLTGRSARDGLTSVGVSRGLPAALAALTSRCLEVDPASRPADALELKGQLALIVESSGAVDSSAPVGPITDSASAPPPLPPRAPPPLRAAGGGPRPARKPTQENFGRWLVRKGNLDFGPFTLAQLEEQIESGDLLGEHLLVDPDKGTSARADANPALTDLLADAAEQQKARRRTQAVVADVAQHKRHSHALAWSIAAVLLVVAVGVFVGVKRLGGDGPTCEAIAAKLFDLELDAASGERRPWLEGHRADHTGALANSCRAENPPRERRECTLRANTLEAAGECHGDRMATLDSAKVSVAISMRKPNRARGRRPAPRGTAAEAGSSTAGAASGGDDFDNEVLALGDASEGEGSSRLDDSEINPVLAGSSGRLVSCLAAGGVRTAEIDFKICGATGDCGTNGRVFAVRVNGSTTSSAARCVLGVMRSMQFPGFQGPRHRASFEMSY
ncbi:MAG: hypothetical protein EXR73_11760 [Myxococcales bacterium]|nr:hypothetical protein [Myxococcales bacterium]